MDESDTAICYLGATLAGDVVFPTLLLLLDYAIPTVADAVWGYCCTLVCFVS
jgi:hypothetical protein